MFGSSKRILIIGLLMVLASASAEYLKPSKRLAEEMPSVNLERIIPMQFGEWVAARESLELIVDPATKGLLSEIYSQILTRTYFNPQGDRIMLSMAYGGEQTKDLQVHLPDVCYAAQGFQIIQNRQDSLSTEYGSLPVKRVLALRENRSEPITYWIVMGKEAVVGINVKLAQLRYGLTGKVPDGILVRVSSIDADEKASLCSARRIYSRNVGSDEQGRPRSFSGAAQRVDAFEVVV